MPIVNWKKEGLVRIPLVIKDKDKNGNEVLAVAGYKTLLPGNNLLKDKEWEQTEPSCKDHMKNGFLELVVEKVETEVKKEVEVKKKVKDEKTGKEKTITEKEIVTEKEEKEVSEISKMSAKKAEEVVKKTVNPETLDSWLESEDRPNVRAAILSQKEEIKNHGSKKEGDE